MEHIVEVKGFNPFMYIFIFEEFLSNPALYEKDNLIKLMNIIKDNQNNLVEIQNKMGTIDSDNDPSPNSKSPSDPTSKSPSDPTSKSPSDPTTESPQINETISILKKMCTPENMIELFMEVVYFNEKSSKLNT